MRPRGQKHSTHAGVSGYVFSTSIFRIMFVFLIVLITLIAIVMTFLVLIQAGKGGGLAGIAAGGATTQILGARQAPDVLEKATWILATLFIILCILTNFTIGGDDTQRSIIQGQSQTTQQEALPQQALPPVEAPAE